ncbi:hypothetical protein LCGC14_1166080 [marine sediment metagenome]|uniref:Glycosyltransferase RgtA/B/C/D-like domain-containing protein n=1 Tax=marine sediment metagenome TaxID=412755 RepID=A0A0F9PWQ2_9ZZZZ
MKIRPLYFLVRNKKLILIYFSSITIQIIIILIFQVNNWVSQHAINTPWFMFLMNTLEPYSDYKYWYQGFARQFFYDDWLPYFDYSSNPDRYKNFLLYLIDIILGNQKLSFIYPPFFFYSIIIPAAININLVFIPLFLANILLPIVVYKFLINFASKKVAEWGFVATALSPLSIFYNGGLFFNTSYVTLFFIIALYFVSKKKFTWAIFFLSVACLFKQTIIFFFPPFLIYIVLQSTEKKSRRVYSIYFKNFLKYTGMLIGMLFLGSIPWIIITPKNYIQSLLVEQSINFNPDFNAPEYNNPVNWYSFLINFGAPYWLIYLLGFLTFTFIGLLIIEIVAIFLLYNWDRKNKLDWIKFLDIIVYTAFISHLFFPRGVYKYYFTLHVPLIILWICFHFKEKLTDNNSIRKVWLLLFVFISFLILSLLVFG